MSLSLILMSFSYIRLWEFFNISLIIKRHTYFFILHAAFNFILLELQKFSAKFKCLIDGKHIFYFKAFIRTIRFHEDFYYIFHLSLLLFIILVFIIASFFLVNLFALRCPHDIYPRVSQTVNISVSL